MVAAGDLDGGFSFTRDAVRALLGRRFPLNARELCNTVAAALLIAHGKRIDAHHLAAEPMVSAARAPVPGPVVDGGRREELVALLVRHRGNVSAIARELATSRTQIDRLLERFALDKDTFR
jgi:transcriptional regulator of acetoin/glycerol metabolism